MSAPSRCRHGTFAYPKRIYRWQGAAHWTLYQKGAFRANFHIYEWSFDRACGILGLVQQIGICGEYRLMKIHIIGCSGSGKTYLANALSKKYNIPHFDLDDIQWDNNAKEYGKKRTLDERKALLQEILYNNDEWIIEGVYYAWVQQSFDEADKIYVLDMPGYLYKSRIIMRSIKRKLGIQKGKRETLKSVYNLLKWTETFQNKNLKEIRSILDRYDDKVIWLSRKKDVEKIIKVV